MLLYDYPMMEKELRFHIDQNEEMVYYYLIYSSYSKKMVLIDRRIFLQVHLDCNR